MAIEQGWPTFCTLRATFRYLKKLAGLTYPSAPNMFNIQYINYGKENKCSLFWNESLSGFHTGFLAWGGGRNLLVHQRSAEI